MSVERSTAGERSVRFIFPTGQPPANVNRRGMMRERCGWEPNRDPRGGYAPNGCELRLGHAGDHDPYAWSHAYVLVEHDGDGVVVRLCYAAVRPDAELYLRTRSQLDELIDELRRARDERWPYSEVCRTTSDRPAP